MRNVALLIACSSLFVVFAACGGSSKKSPTATPAAPKDETAFARSMLLSADDFPSGWVETPNTTDTDENPINAQCGKPAEKGKTGRAASSDFAADENSASIGEVVIVFARDDDAAAGIEAVPALIDCAVKLINDGKLNSPGVEFSGTTSKKVTVDAPSDISYAFEIQMTGKATAQPDQEVTVYLTLVFAKTGRVGYQLTAQGTGEPPDPAEVATYARKAASKLKQQP
jgi:hypothetical protein